MTPAKMFSGAEAYERGMGTWSRVLAPLFIDFIGSVNDGDRVLDVGCGTGSLAFTMAKTTKAAKIVGIDPSEGFIEYARSENADPRLTFEVGDAQDLPYADASFDKSLALLVINFIPDAPKAAREMRRVTMPGGLVATSMWDNGGDMELHRAFWDAAVALDSEAERLHEKHRLYGSAEALHSLWVASGLKDVEVDSLSIPMTFDSFDKLWVQHALGQGPAGAYTLSLPSHRQQALKERLRREILGGRLDGPFTLRSKAWAVRGIVPAD